MSRGNRRPAGPPEAVGDSRPWPEHLRVWQGQGCGSDRSRSWFTFHVLAQICFPGTILSSGTADFRWLITLGGRTGTHTNAFTRKTASDAYDVPGGWGPGSAMLRQPLSSTDSAWTEHRRGDRDAGTVTPRTSEGRRGTEEERTSPRRNGKGSLPKAVSKQTLTSDLSHEI